MQFERARASDAEALTRIAHAAKRYWGYPESWIALWWDALTVTPEVLERQTVVCAREGTELRGFYGLSGNGPTLELEHLWVAPEHIGLGIGRRLFEHALETARGAGELQLRIASDPNAEGFYLRMGARRMGSVASIPEGRVLPVLVRVIS